MKKIGWLIIAGVLMVACIQEADTDGNVSEQSGERHSKLAATSVSGSVAKEKAEKRKQAREQKEQEKLDKQTTIEITPSVHDFGTIAKEVPVKTIFKVKNTGDKPLVIEDAQASCGCTVPRRPQEPIQPGEEDEIEVTFTSTPGQAGTTINKTVTVKGNFPGGSKTVHIKGDVEK